MLFRNNSKTCIIVKPINICKSCFTSVFEFWYGKVYHFRKIFEKHEFNENDLNRKPWYSIYRVFDDQCVQQCKGKGLN